MRQCRRLVIEFNFIGEMQPTQTFGGWLHSLVILLGSLNTGEAFFFSYDAINMLNACLLTGTVRPCIEVKMTHLQAGKCSCMIAQCRKFNRVIFATPRLVERDDALAMDILLLQSSRIFPVRPSYC